MLRAMKDDSDAFLWLEEVLGERALDWVRARNDETRTDLATGEAFEALQARILEVLDSDARIPYVTRSGSGLYYNFWQDAEHPRGLWRRTSPAQYAREQPRWETVLDLDALAAAEGEGWTWAGAHKLPPDDTRALISLSRGGSDATLVREFDLESLRFVDGGFALPEGKHNLHWRDHDSLYVGTDFGPGSRTDSGYPRIAKLWRRATPLSRAETVFEGAPSDISVHAYRDHTPGFERDFVTRGVDFFTSELYLLTDDQLTKVDKPGHVRAFMWRQFIIFRGRRDWALPGRALSAGTLAAAELDAWMGGEREVQVLFEPGERASLVSCNPLRNHLVLNVLDNVRNRVHVSTPDDGGEFTRRPLGAVADLGEARVWGIDPWRSDDYFVSVTDFLTPTTLYRGAVLADETEKLKELPAFFDSEGLSVSQHEVASADGTRIPYFQVSATDLPLDGSHPTLLSGYGGFEVPMLPDYRGGVGLAWLCRGGVYVLANIRGGGEFGPAWHRAALKDERPRAYEDFIAIAEDLVARGVTRPPQLGCMGGSNGGLLVGNMLTRRPDLFGAIVCSVPLLDMRRYHTLLAGASWMAEYGDPDDPEQWAFIRGFSPYHNLRDGTDYPPVLFTTSTRDDRVHPAHARKMAALMRERGHRVHYYENMEGGHAGAADNRQQAFMSALAYAFLWRELGGGPGPDRPRA